MISNKKEIKLYQNTIRSLNIVLREDGAVSDLGYPVATELEDSRIFTAYYYIINNGNDWGGGTRYIAVTFFELPN